MHDIEWHREAILRGGDAEVGIRVRYRAPGTRRWTRFLIVLDEGQTVGDLHPHIKLIAEAHSRGEHLNTREAAS